MKNYLISIGLLVVGLVLGWFLFGGQSATTEEHAHGSTSESVQQWTCSMDPQIMQAEPGSCPICGMDLIPAESNGEGLAADQFELSPNAVALANIQTLIVGEESMEYPRVKLSGTLQENETTQKVQISYFSGRIERLYVQSVGEQVRKGQALATLYSPELIAAQQELLVTAALKETQPELYQAVKNKLRLWKLTSNQITEIERSGTILENITVYATVSGVVLKKLVAKGDQVLQGQTLFTLSDLQTLWANFDVYENQLPLFSVGQQLSIKTMADSRLNIEGVVSFIDPVLNLKTRTAGLRVSLDNKEGKLKPGMFVEGHFKDLRKELQPDQIRIPASAVLWTGIRSLVYIKSKKEGAVFEMRNVLLGNKIGAYYEIIEGLEKGEEVVTNGSFTLDAAAQLKGVPSMMSQQADGMMSTSAHHH